MYKLSVPISVDILTEETMPVVLQKVRQCKAQRVFVTILEAVYSPEASLYTMPERVEAAVRYFQAAGLEVGVWMNAFGHGSALAYQQEETDETGYTQIEGVYGDKFGGAYCPLDEKFAAMYGKAVRTVARMKPDLIMLDDDYRLNTRTYYMGCFCPLHRQEYFQRIGREVPREELEKLIFTGGKNPYRTAFLDMYADTMLNFSKMLRKIVDEEAPEVRMGVCLCFDNWDFCGTDGHAIARALAGNTEPFLRIHGAPYWGGSLIEVIEDSRMEFAWCRQAGIEAFAEGDTYPRPRYKVPAQRLELFDLALLCDGTGDGILKYMFDYSMDFAYETGYADRHIRNENLRTQMQSIFANKSPVGLYPVNVLHKIRDWVLPEACPDRIADKLVTGCRSVSRHLLSRNSIPTAHTPGEYPSLICGENAWYVKPEDLGNGAILDATAAMILMESGIDTGICAIEPGEYFGEYFLREKNEILGVDTGSLKKLRCSPEATVLSRFTPGDDPASYTYENAEGQRFLVLAWDHYFGNDNVCFTGSYHRQSQLVEAVRWLCGRPLPAVCPKNPELYMQTSKGEDGMAVALFNIFPDEIFAPTVQLDRVYSEITFVNCTGTLEGDRVVLSDIGPYGVAAFEVR